jgi:hypothetical protein
MNIFILDDDLKKSVQMLCDQHLNKQLLELAQIISTVMGGPYKPTHRNHPVTIWAKDNLEFCRHYADALHEEYKHRSNKTHKSYEVILKILDITTHNVSYSKFPIRNDVGLMKEKFKEWLSREKPLVPRWTNRNVPCEFTDILKDSYVNRN